MSLLDKTKGDVMPIMESALRQLAVACFNSGYGALDWIDRLKDPKAGLMISRVSGLSRADVNAIMLDELTILANKIQRDRDLIEAQAEKY
ncbi:TPA: hypothetical protein RQN15_002193 [Aeromonas hydrophila]|nr:hypothetical protein [Aeromonas hydrophila]